MPTVGDIRPLDETHNRTDFNSGQPALDHWFERHAWRNQQQGTSRTAILPAEDNHVAGYVSLAVGEIRRAYVASVDRRNAPDPLPVALLARLAGDQNHQVAGHGKLLLEYAFRQTIQIARVAGCFALLTHPIDDDARNFYTRWGFRDLPADPGRSMYIRVRDLQASGFAE